MHTKTMEGLVGARTNMDVMNVPMRVFRDARRRGDTAVMERAMGYASDFAGKAQEYKKIAEEGMKKDAEEAREKARTEQEKAIEKRKVEKADAKKKAEGESEKKPEGTGNQYSDILQISPEGKALWEEKKGAEGMEPKMEKSNPDESDGQKFCAFFEKHI